MFYIHVLRVKCEPLPQPDLLRIDGESDPVSVIARSFESRPTADVGRGSEWHIGNVELSADGGVAFAMGRTQAVKSPQFDNASHNFVEEDAMRAPFTIGVFDQRSQACGVMRKSGVSQSSSEIAGKLEKLLNAAPFAREANKIIVVEPVADPVKFFEAIGAAEAVTRFRFTVSRPNPHDVDRLIQRPAEEFTSIIGGDISQIEVRGDNLDKSVIVETSSAVAAVGESASADIKPQGGAASKRVYLSGNPVVEAVETRVDQSVVSAILAATRSAYDRVRNLKSAQ